MSNAVNQEGLEMRALQMFLYEHPLYDGCQSGEKYLDVLAAGLDPYGMQLIDLCLQSAQNLGSRLRVDVLTDTESSRDRYLEARPALSDFFEINDCTLKGESYGEIHFHCADTAKLSGDSRQRELPEMLEELLSDKDQRNPGYILIASGNDDMNRRLAALAHKYAVPNAAVIGYICEEAPDIDERENNVFPIRAHVPEGMDVLQAELERMAFNAHLIWEQNLNIDFKDVRSKFLEPYNYESSISNVLSVKYKLHSIGIDLSSCGPEKAAAEFERALKKSGARDQLIYREHKRWVAQRICEGWLPQRDLACCADGKTKHPKDTNNPEDISWHTCIVRSRADHLLSDITQNEGLVFWDKANEDRISQLDDLDQMSVRLHQMYLAHAEEAKKKNLLGGEIVREIRSLISDSPQAGAAFQEWLVCLKDLWNRDQSKFRLYKGLRNDFLHAVDQLKDPITRDAVRIQVQALEQQFQPILSSSEYCDYKKKDEDLIDNIPFILTYSCKTTMIIPVDLAADAPGRRTDAYEADDETDGNDMPVIAAQNGFIFSHLAAAAVVNPERMIFLFDGSRAKDKDRKKLLLLAKSAVQYRRKKKLRSEIILVTAFPKGDKDKRKTGKKLENALEEVLGPESNVQVVSLLADPAETIPDAIGQYLLKRKEEDEAEDRRSGDLSLRYYAMEEKKCGVSAQLNGRPEYQFLRRYTFAQKEMRFASSDGFMAFSCIRKYPCLLVSDLLSMKKYVNTGSYYPEFHGDYADLWRKYKAGTAAWKDFVGRLKKYAEDKDEIATFGIEPLSDAVELTYYLPSGCHEAAEKLVKALIRYEAVGCGSYVSYCTTESCVVSVQVPPEQEDPYNRLFSDPYRLTDAAALSVYTKFEKTSEGLSSHLAVVRFDNLRVDQVDMGPDYHFGVCYDDMADLLDYFHREKHYITRPVISDDKKVSFTCATPNIKQLLISEGKMLEVYVYHKLRESGIFDDVVSGYEIAWENEGEEKGEKNELDCIATRGFTSFFIECKARTRIEGKFYDNLVTSVKRAGINATAILIADTGETGQEPSPKNAASIEYGRNQNVITIWKPAEIAAIDDTIRGFI